MSRTGGPESFEIAALRKKQAAVWDPMAPGVGTPWEDRGTHGTVGAFFKTCLASMTGPRQLVAAIRRPETTTDARTFVIGCAIPWGLSAAGHLAYGLYAKAHAVYPNPANPKQALGEVQPLWVGIYLAVALAGAAVGVVFLWMLYTAIYDRLVAQERRPVKLTEPLLANVSAYAFGPSLLAVIPVFGPPIALVAMLLVMIVMGTSARLRLRFAAAAVDAVLGFAAVLAIGLAGSFLSRYVNNLLPATDPVPLVDQSADDANQPAIRPSGHR